MRTNSKAVWPTKRLFQLIATLLLLFGFFPQLTMTYGQGNLAPPGPPAPTMKSLDQIEPRTPISSLPYAITSPGAYYVTANLTGVSGSNGITIAANDVTLDLGGFSLIGVPGSSSGIAMNGNRTNVCVGNGTLRGWNLEGIDGTTTQSSIFTDLKVIGSGDVGLRSGTASTVTRCTTIANAQEGILAFDGGRFSQCTSISNGGSGISVGGNCRVSDCQAQFNAGNGIAVGSGCSVSGCICANNAYSGISTAMGSTISDCTAEANLLRGIDAGLGNLVVHCAVVGRNYGVASGNYGILAGDGTVVKDCTSRYNIGSGTDISGIRAGNNCTLIGCAVTTNSDYGILTGSNCVVQGCSENTANSAGIMTGAASSVRGCSAVGNNVGVQAGGPATTIEGCVASGNLTGIYVNADGCLILNNTCEGNGTGTTSGVGIQCNGSYNRIDGNHCANNPLRGIQVLSSASSLHNVVTRNSSLTNAAQTIGYDVNTSTSDIGPIGKAATATSPWANIQ